VRLQILRNGRLQVVTVRIEAPQVQEIRGDHVDARLEGVRFERVLDRDGTPRIRISAVQSRSLAGRAGLREGDVILSVNRREVTRLEDLAAAAEGGRGGLLLNVQRGTSAFFLMLQ
jgi:serine protease Do/serine protease DegQ